MPKRFMYTFLLVLSLFTQAIFVDAAYGKNNNLSLSVLTVADGLSQGTINGVIQDKTGFIWLATTSGINIYDGNSIRTLSGPDNAFKDHQVFQIIEDNEGLIWINVQGEKLYVYHPKTNIYQLIKIARSGSETQLLRDIFIGENNNIWLLSSHSVGRFNKLQGSYEELIDLKEKLPGTHSFYQVAKHDDIVFLSSSIGSFAVDTATNKWRKLPEINRDSTEIPGIDVRRGNVIYTLNIGVNSNDNKWLYLGSADGVFALPIDEIPAYIHQEIPLPNYTLIIENVAPWRTLVDGEVLYLATDKGLYSLNMQNNQADFLFGFSDFFDDITNNNILSLAKDREGHFWLGSESKGVFHWNPQQALVTNYRYKKNSDQSLSYNEVWSILLSRYHEDLLWVGTSNGLNLINNKTKSVVNYVVNQDSKSIYTESYIYSIFELSAEQLLLFTSKGVRIFDIEQGKYVPLPFSDEIRQLLALVTLDVYKEKDILWLTNNEGLYRINLSLNNIEKINDSKGGIPKNSRMNLLGLLPEKKLLLFASSNNLWGLDTSNNQISLLYQHAENTDNQWSSFDNFAVDNNNILWLSYPTKGLIGLSLDTFERKYFYNHENSIIDNNVYSVASDAEGDVWFSSHNGLFLLDSNTQHIRHFTIRDGLVATEFNSRAFAKAEGNFIYGAMEGLSIFDPLALKQITNQAPFKVYITDVKVLSRTLSVPLVIENGADIRLNYDDVGIKVAFSTFTYDAHKDVVYDFKLTGKNNLSYPQTTESYITFPSLASGHHTLEIRAKSPDTGKFSAPAILTFRVGYAPWLSPLAYVLYFLVSLTLVLFFYRYRKAQQQLLLDVHEQVKYREKRLQLALTGSNSEVWDWQASDNLMFGKRIAIDLGYENEALFYSFDEHVNLIHPEERDNFLTLWQLFITNANLDDNFVNTYRLKTIDGKWLWYKDLGKIVAVNSSGAPQRITGSYTNITESRAKDERAQYYGDAFKQTKDWVLIIDEKISRITANNAICEVFGWHKEEFDFDPSIIGIEKDRRYFYKNLLMSLKEGQHWSGEELVKTNNGKEYHVMVNISAAKSSVNHGLHYIFILTDISAQKSAEQELRFLANYDHLTGLPNRSLLLERIKHAITSSGRKEKSIALFFIDLDKFKQVNDSLGHDFGDLLLKEITHRLTLVLREDDTVARIGGDEFVVLFESFNDNIQFGKIAQKIITAIGEPVQLKKNRVSVGASIGIALYPEDAKNSDKLLRNADVAMYHAKQAGRNNFQFYKSAMNLEAKERLHKESQIKHAVSNNEFINHYQPIIDAYTGKVVGFELLMRWKKDDIVILPNKFILLAEEMGLIIPMTEAAIARGIRVLKQWGDVRKGLYLSINIAPQHFIKDTLVPYIEALLSEHQLPASALRIEVTESAFISEPEKAIKTMNTLSALGVTLALDDFGTGFSSLTYLKQLPLDIIKIDRSFVAGIGINDADEAIVDTTLVLAKRLNMQCIAEGVETHKQLEYLVKHKCHFIQGYFYYKPMSAQKIIKLLLEDEIETTIPISTQGKN